MGGGEALQREAQLIGLAVVGIDANLAFGTGLADRFHGRIVQRHLHEAAGAIAIAILHHRRGEAVGDNGETLLDRDFQRHRDLDAVLVQAGHIGQREAQHALAGALVIQFLEHVAGAGAVDGEAAHDPVADGLDVGTAGGGRRRGGGGRRRVLGEGCAAGEQDAGNGAHQGMGKLHEKSLQNQLWRLDSAPFHAASALG